MSEARNVYPRLCWGCLSVIETYEHDQALLNYGGYCVACSGSEMLGLRAALQGRTERMNDVSEQEELLRAVSMSIVNIPKDEHGRRQLHCRCGQALLVYLKYLHGDGNCLKWYCVQPLGADPHSLWLEHCPACGVAFGYPPPLQEQVSMSDKELVNGGVIENGGIGLMIGNGSPELVCLPQDAKVLPSGTYKVDFTTNINPTLLNPSGSAFTGYVGDVPWQYIPPPAPWQQPVQFVPSTTFPTEQDLRTFVKRCVREELDELAREMHEHPGVQPGTWRKERE